MVEAHGDRFGVEPICRTLGYPSASVVYARRHRPPSKRSVRDEEILAEIRAVRKGYAVVYGARRTWKELRRRGVDVARCTVERLMRQAGMLGVARGRTPRTITLAPSRRTKSTARPENVQISTLGQRSVMRPKRCCRSSGEKRGVFSTFTPIPTTNRS